MNKITKQPIVCLEISTSGKAFVLSNIIANQPLVKMPDCIDYRVACTFYLPNGLLCMKATPITGTNEFTEIDTIKVKKSLDVGMGNVMKIEIRVYGFYWEAGMEIGMVLIIKYLIQYN